ncbi:DUF1835 domain-containing protein [Leptospira yasudae]|uniref:DUF3658 domain-containing protein n=1 Tax=Leptospira yasudae TaxID=2202201 RepID=UPI001C4F7DF9|nr:DUF3658 domain-containing protein [Leptospira yasudae]MBW0434455.1 DUF1835 domain-containing protein [Leptospira yasudae]
MSALHLVSNDCSLNKLKALFQENEIFSIMDSELCGGPLSDLQERLLYIAELLYDNRELWKEVEWIREGHIEVLKKAESKEIESIVIWHDDFANDQVFLRLICRLLREYQGLIQIVNVRDWNLFDSMSFDEFEKSRVELKTFERNRYVDEFVEIQNKEKFLRDYKDGRIVFLPIDHYDLKILALISHNWRAAIRVVGDCLADGFEKGRRLSDSFYTWRIRNLIRDGLVEVEGYLGRMQDFRVRLPDIKRF